MKIIIDCRLDNWNETINKSRGNKYNANKNKKGEMMLIRYFLRNVPKITEYPIKLNCEWHVKNINSDLDNKSLKSVLDEMQNIGILENDNIKHIPEINHRAIKDTKEYLKITIEKC